MESKKHLCNWCKGTGVEPDLFSVNKRAGEPCGTCDGTGFDTSSTDNLVCPYCGYEEEECWEFGEESENHMCGDCGKKYSFTTETSRYFTSHQVPCLNGEDHKWKPRSYPGRPYAKRCEHCHKYEWGEYVAEAMETKPMPEVPLEKDNQPS